MGFEFATKLAYFPIAAPALRPALAGDVGEGAPDRMALLTAPPMDLVTAVQRLTFRTEASISLMDITDGSADVVRSLGLRDGIVTVFSRHTTGSIRIQGRQSLLLDELAAFLERQAPTDAHYGHNNFRIRTDHMQEDQSPNGHSHCLRTVRNASETIPLEDGELLLGARQRVFRVEMDGPHAHRDVPVQVLGSRD